MNIFDIITLIVFLASVFICIWRGFLKTVIKLGAPVLAALGARFFGRSLGELILPELVKKSPSGMSASTLELVNSTISSIVGTLIVFVVLFIVFKLLAGIFAKIIKKVTHSSLLDRVTGAIFGLLIGFAVMVALAEALEIVAMVGTFISSDIALFEMMEDSVLFKYFM